MTKSTITRERIQRIIRAIDSESYDEEEIREWLTSDEIMGLARMALAAMDSEPVEMPLDYLQGHKDGLEWAAQLAEDNHPETGDWLYDDPIELAKAIRKGPDMPPAQPVADSEPDRNPVLAYADSYRDMAKQGVESVPIWSVITDLERNIAPLYRHAQPAPVVPDEKDKTVDADDHPLLWSFNEGWNACRAAMLQAGTLTNEGTKQAWTGIPDIDNAINMLDRIDTLDSCDDDRIEAVKTVLRGLAGNSPMWVGVDWAKGCELGNSPVIPDGLPDGVNIYHGPKEKTILVLKQDVAVNQDCWCRTCRPVTLNDMRFVVCPDCGNKRCPRANDHRNACTGSNEPGQEGSAYPDTPREVK